MMRFLRDNGLSLALFGCFLVSQTGLSIVGQRQHNQELITHHLPTITYGESLVSEAFQDPSRSEAVDRDPRLRQGYDDRLP